MTNEGFECSEAKKVVAFAGNRTVTQIRMLMLIEMEDDSYPGAHRRCKRRLFVVWQRWILPLNHKRDALIDDDRSVIQAHRATTLRIFPQFCGLFVENVE
jgi:hypothetical protein